MAVALLSLLPEPWKGRLATHGAVHDLAHIAAFLAVTVFTIRPVRDIRKWPAASAGLFLFGFILEILQTHVYRNRLEWSDILDDLAGIALGILICASFRN